jgi:hypothetical protein
MHHSLMKSNSFFIIFYIFIFIIFRSFEEFSANPENIFDHLEEGNLPYSIRAFYVVVQK